MLGSSYLTLHPCSMHCTDCVMLQTYNRWAWVWWGGSRGSMQVSATTSHITSYQMSQTLSLISSHRISRSIFHLLYYILSPTSYSLPAIPPPLSDLLSLLPLSRSYLTSHIPLSLTPFIPSPCCGYVGAAYRLEKDLLTMRKHTSVGESE